MLFMKKLQSEAHRYYVSDAHVRLAKNSLKQPLGCVKAVINPSTLRPYLWA